jgi:hypothetical protein
MENDWHFYRKPRGRGKDFSNAAEMNFKLKLEPIVRESIQNSIDANITENELNRDSQPCEVLFQYYPLVGEEKSIFLETINFDNTLLDHLLKSKTKDISNKDAKILFNTKNNVEFPLFAIHDFNTTGLLGEENPKGEEKSSFAALCKDEGNTEKEQTKTKGGSYGMGKTVFWKFSQTRTVLFLSVTKHPETEETKIRLFGVTKLGYHELDNTGYDGIGYFGEQVDENGENYTVSAWYDDLDDPDLDFIPKQIRDQRIDEKGKLLKGTSIIIIGIEPTNDFDLQKNGHTSLFNLDEEILKWFWPAITINKLKVYVESDEHDWKSEHNSSDMDDLESISDSKIYPMVKLFKKIEENRELIKNNEKVMGINYKIGVVEFPKPKDSQNNVNDSGEFLLAIKLDSYFENVISDEHSNQIAFIRGAFSVVEYQNQKPPLGGEKYWGILLAGEAFGSELGFDSNLLLDDFLRYAETPSHDQWNYHKSKLSNIYGPRSGASTRLSEMLREFKKISDLILSSSREGRIKLNDNLTNLFASGRIDRRREPFKTSPDYPNGGNSDEKNGEEENETSEREEGFSNEPQSLGKLVKNSIKLERESKNIKEMFKLKYIGDDSTWYFTINIQLFYEDRTKIPGDFNLESKITISGNQVDKLNGNWKIEDTNEVEGILEIILPDEFKNSVVGYDFKLVEV